MPGAFVGQRGRDQRRARSPDSVERGPMPGLQAGHHFGESFGLLPTPDQVPQAIGRRRLHFRRHCHGRILPLGPVKKNAGIRYGWTQNGRQPSDFAENRPQRMDEPGILLADNPLLTTGRAEP